MKKIYTLIIASLIVCMSVSAQQVGYLLTETTIDALPLENEGGVDQKPEQNAANWFVSAYGANGTLVALSDLTTINPATVKVLWINIDRSSFSESQFNAIFTDDIVASIRNYVEAGGSLLLTKQAARLAYRTGRIGYANNWSDTGYSDGGDTWYAKTLLGQNTTSPTNRSNHDIFKNINIVDNQFPLVGAVKRSDRNNHWSDYFRKDGAGETHYDNGNVLRLTDFETDWNCEALANWPSIYDYCLPMIINFKPDYEDFQGGMIAICLAAYQWGTANNDPTNIGNVHRLTQNCIEYLYGSDPRLAVEASWDTTPTDGIIGSTMTASVTTTGIISWSSSDNTVASVSSEGVIAYNGFGTCTITAAVSKDGYADTDLTQSVTVTGGSAAEYAYALPYSLYTMQHYDNEEGYYPDYQAARWFYDNYVALGNGCFIRPADYSASAAIPAAIKVLWINNDHVGQDKNTYYTDLGGDNFLNALLTFSANSGKIYLSKQACYLAYKMNKIYEPSWANGGYVDANADNWTINAGNLGYALDAACHKDRSSHPIYSDLTLGSYGYNNGSQTIPYQTYMLAGTTRRTDNNNMWTDMNYDYNGTHLANNDVNKLSGFESAWNCQVLAVWGHVQDFCAAGLIEFFPTATNSTIIANGFAAYQLGTNNSNATAIANVKQLTANILSYLRNVDTYTRTVPADHYGTICLPRSSVALSEGMTVYSVLSNVEDGIMLEQVNTMAAGIPYFFYSTASEIAVTMTGAPVSTPQSGNGLIGNLGPDVLVVPLDNDNYILGSNNTLYYIDIEGIEVGANRAYLDRSEIVSAAPAQGAPTRKMRVQQAKNTPTEIEQTGTQNNQPCKQLIDGQLYIRQGNNLYDATGVKVK